MPAGSQTNGLALQFGDSTILAQHVVDCLSAEVAVLDREGKIVMVNAAWERFASRQNTAEQSQNLGVGANYLAVCRSASGETAKEVLRGIEEVLSGRRPDFSLEYPCHSPTVRRWFLLQVTSLQCPPCGAVSLHIDITDRKLLEQRLQEHQERFRAALENSPVVLFNQDRESRYTWINSPVLGWAEQEYVGRTDSDIVGGEDGERLTAIKRAVLESGVGARVETSVTFQGETHYFDLNVVPMRDDVGAIIGITCACTDITPMKRVEAEREKLMDELRNAQHDLANRNLELEALHNEKTQWLGMAAHDLGNPLSSILACCEVLTNDLTDKNSEHTAMLKSIQSCGQFMLDLLHDVQDLSTIETGSQRFLAEPTDLRSLIEETIAFSRPIADRKNTRIEARWAERVAPVTLDRPKMTQVFLNLIGNAIKFCGNGSNVYVTIVDQPTNVLVSVQDNGPGIPPDELGSIFMPFQRGRRNVSAQRGTGLGLAICKRIVERHHGQIWAENAIEGGAVFFLSLPRQAQHSAPLESMHS
ncbi:MAG: ATP-binding protein [Bryobacteraceae bacterium]